MRGKEVLCIVSLVGVLLALNACTKVREQLGLTKQSPDEFRVVSRAPLTLPPNFGLRPPQPGVLRPQEGSATDQARRAIFRAEPTKDPTYNEAVPSDGHSAGERSLLKAAGADETDPGIRVLVNRETAEINDASESFLEMLVFWRKDPARGVLVDADAEARRLRENAALGKDVTEGETPTIERRKKALLEGIF